MSDLSVGAQAVIARALDQIRRESLSQLEYPFWCEAVQLIDPETQYLAGWHTIHLWVNEGYHSMSRKDYEAIQERKSQKVALAHVLEERFSNGIASMSEAWWLEVIDFLWCLPGFVKLDLESVVRTARAHIENSNGGEW